MKVSINCKEYDFHKEPKFSEIVEFVFEMKKDDPMIRKMREKAGIKHILFVLNGRVVQPDQYDSLQIQEGDDIRYVLPFSGG